MTNKAWSEEDETQLRFLYLDDDMKDVLALAEIFQKGHRSVISKLVQMGIYIKPEDINPSKPRVTVKHMLRELEIMLEIDIEGTNLNKKENLEILVAALKAKLC